MEKFEQIAMLSIGRAVFFAGFAISLTMMGVSYDFALALRIGAVLTLALSAILLWFAQTAHRRKLERGEVWLLLGEKNRPSDQAARRVLVTVVRETYLFFSVRAFALGTGMLAISIAMRLAGIEAGLG